MLTIAPAADRRPGVFSCRLDLYFRILEKSRRVLTAARPPGTPPVSLRKAAKAPGEPRHFSIFSSFRKSLAPIHQEHGQDQQQAERGADEEADARLPQYQADDDARDHREGEKAAARSRIFSCRFHRPPMPPRRRGLQAVEHGRRSFRKDRSAKEGGQELKVRGKRCTSPSICPTRRPRPTRPS